MKTDLNCMTREYLIDEYEKLESEFEEYKKTSRAIQEDLLKEINHLKAKLLDK